jgi:NAD(P)-dependent dehydrogenase (short-subunit alcohol dehydrogenase family)
VAGKLEERVAIVTGGSSGIGRASAVAFATEGAKVAVLDRAEAPREGGQPTAEVITNSGGKAIFVQTDVTQQESVANAFGQALETLGSPDIIMTAAGNVGPTGDSRQISIDELDAHFALNVKGSFLCVQAALRQFTEKRYGKVIMVASNFGLVGVPGLAAYCAGKAAVIGFVRSLAGEFGPFGINVNALCPGATRTAINVHFRADPEVQRSWQEMTPLRMADGEYTAEPQDQANAALFLASDESRFMTGACLVADGGWIAL